MAGTVTNNVNTITNAESADSANWDDRGGGPGSGQNTDVVVQGTDCRGRRIDNQTRGFGYDTTTADDQSATDNHLGVWVAVLQAALITSVDICLSDSATDIQTGNWDGHRFTSTDFLAGTPRGAGFRKFWVDVSRTRDTGSGTLNLANARNFGCEFNMGDVGGTSQNCLIDGIHHSVSGLTLSAGTVSSPAVWDDLVQYDINTTDDRQLGILDDNFLNGRVVIGVSGSATVFRGSNEVILAGSQPLSANDWVRVDWNAENASADILGGAMTFVGVHFIFTGTSGTLDLETLSLISAPLAISLNSNVVWGGKIADSPQLTVSGATITDLIVQEANAESAILLSASNSSTDITFLENNVFGDIAHSIEIDTAGTYSFDGWDFSSNTLGRARQEFDAQGDVDAVNEEVDITGHGFSTGDAIVYTDRGGSQTMGLTDGTTYWVRAVTVDALAFYTSQANAESDTSRINLTAAASAETHSIESAKADVFVNLASGSVTLSISNADTPTVRIATGTATVTITTDPVTTLVNVKDNTGTNLQNARVYLRAADGTGPLPFEDSVTISRATTTATVTHTGHGLSTGQKVKIQGITDKTEDNAGVHTITVTDANTYTYTTTDSGSTNYTGTITSTGVVLEGLTDASGNISDSRALTSNQPVTGFARKSTSSPRFKTFDLNGTINNTTGLTINVRMILDE